MHSFGDGIMEGEQAAEDPLVARERASALANMPRGTRGDCVAPEPAEAELATCQRKILQSASSGIDVQVNAEIRHRLDLMALATLRRGYGRDARAVARQFARMRQLESATAKAMTDARRVDQTERRANGSISAINLSHLRRTIAAARVRSGRRCSVLLIQPVNLEH
jgi:hypothetical protein